MKLKRRQNYKKLKEDGKIKLIKDFSSREQRKIRKEWRTRSSKYRRNKKDNENMEEFIESNTPPQSPEAMEVHNAMQPSTSRQKESGRKISRQNRDRKTKKLKN